MLRTLHEMGIKPDYMYIAGMASIGLSLTSWLASRKKEDTARADRWGIFIGHWAPTFIALGNALRTYEKD